MHTPTLPLQSVARRMMFALALLCAASPVIAAKRVSYTNSIPQTLTDFSTPENPPANIPACTFPKFNPALGVLTHVHLAVVATIEGEAGIENLDSLPQVITVNFGANLYVNRPDNLSTLLAGAPNLLFMSDPLPKFDGIVDYGGDSGEKFSGLHFEHSFASDLSLPADLAAFTGPGVVKLPMGASAATMVSGSGNIYCKFRTEAGMKIIVSYDFTLPHLPCVEVDCVPTTNPAGKKIPTAGANPKSGMNPDGFYELRAWDNCNASRLFLYVKDSAEGPCGGNFAAGPYAPGTKVKLTQSPGQRSVQPMAGVITAHIHTKGEPVLVAVDAAGKVTPCTTCFVPPPPK